MRTTFIYIVFIFISNFSFSQSIIVKGKVLDKHQKPLLYANIMAEPIDSSQIEFTVTDDFGRFQMRLAMNQKYNFNVSYIGYKPKILTLELSKDTDLDIILDESIEVLDEVKINAKLAVSIKKDTITYQTDKFTSGEERKLRDVLKKLPGVEVDKAGNVSVQGKRVTKVLVEDKRFFTGDSKLAVNNIPADVVDEIEILDNYSEVAILKGLEDSDDMAMNIRIKEGKKRFWFGDIESGTGITDRHLVHPSIFYYSPKTSVNLIGDLNNIGSKSFTFKDYLDFEGGYSKILRNTKAYFSHLNGDFAQFLNDKNFKDSRHSFVAASLNQSLSERTSLIGYVIYSKTNNRQESNVTNQYVNDFGGLTHNNKAIESMSFTEAQNLWNHYATINIDHEVDWRYHSARIQKINNMLAHQPIINPSAEYINFTNYITGQFTNHVNTQSLSNAVSLMTGYMIYQWQLQYLYSNPNHTFPGGYNFYFPYNHRDQIRLIMNNIINNAGGGGTHDIGEPNMTPEEIMREYSMTGMNLGNRAASFYEDKDALREEAAKFQEQNGYDSNSKNMVKRLAEYFLDDEPFIPESYWEGTQSWGQDSDRPERLMNVRLSSQALSWGLGNFGRVLEALGNDPDDPYGIESKGKLIRSLLYANTPPEAAEIWSFSDEQLGKLFDFDFRGSNFLGIQFSIDAKTRIQELEHYDNLYNWDLFSNPLKLNMLHILADGGTINFERQFAISSSVTDCVRNILERIVNSNTNLNLSDLPLFVRQELNLSGLIMDIFSNAGDYHLVYEVASIPVPMGGTPRNARTLPDPNTMAYTITLDSSYVANATDLAIARTIIHESLHAYLSFVYNNQVFPELTNSLSHLLAQNGNNPNTSQHILMSQDFVSAMANSLAVWDNFSLLFNYYDYLSWSGEMVQTPAFNALDSTTQGNILQANINEGQAGAGSQSNSNALGINNCN